jgi:hypothetical protein
MDCTNSYSIYCYKSFTYFRHRDIFKSRKTKLNVSKCFIVLRIMTIPITTASAEMNFSRLKLIKTYFRKITAQKRLSGFNILSIENESCFCDGIFRNIRWIQGNSGKTRERLVFLGGRGGGEWKLYSYLILAACPTAVAYHHAPLPWN